MRVSLSWAPLLIVLNAVACSLAFPTREAPAQAGSGDAGTTPATDAAAAADDARAEAESGTSGTTGRSCAGLGATCAGRDCCASAEVPGTTYKRSYDGVANTDARFEATVSTLRLDVFEVTVGRFRRFVDDYARPPVGSGGNPGWKTEYDGLIAADGDGMKAALATCTEQGATWTADPGANESLPIDCIRWHEAFAFCVWDGGRLPTEAEWNLAAAGGKEQRAYPWTGAAIDPSHAVFGAPGPLAVGSRSPLGDGRWGHADLAGNVAEWTLDTKGEYPLPCLDCANASDPSQRVVRGGSFAGGASDLLASARPLEDPVHRVARIGVRCAR